jgi:hypothetical protein
MARNRHALMTTLMTTALLAAGAAWAADKPAPMQVATTQQNAADKDYGKLSADGSTGYQDLALTRLAIFDGRVDDAKKYVNMADAAFGKAKGDDTVFTKAEVDLKPKVSKTSAAAPADKTKDEMKKPIAWLPVDGSMAINEDFSDNPAKKAAVAEANKSLKSGDRKSAMDTLKLAHMNIDVTLAVVPLEQTISAVHQAAADINDGKYYEASQSLRKTEESVRFDTTSISGLPAE